MRLVIGGPTLALVPASFAIDLAMLLHRTLEHGPWAGVTLGYVGATYVHVGREGVLERTLTAQATHLLWLDTDMQVPPDTAIRLAAHDRPIVACNCVMKDPRQIFTAVRDGVRIATRPDSHWLEAVDTVGLAVLLMRTDVVRDLPRPWFRHGTTEDGGDIGEDLMFCHALRAAGHTIWIDHDLSKEVGHIGQFTFRPARETPVPV